MRFLHLRSVAVFATAVATAIAIGACGGGGDDRGDDASFEGETVASSDGVLTMQVPEGAAAGGVEVTITRIEAGDLPAKLRDVDAVVVGYELSPDGAEFSQPLVVTFRVDPLDHGLNLADGAVPFGFLLGVSAAGEFESLEGGELSRDGNAIVARAEISHFSDAIFIFSNNTSVELRPPEVEMDVGEVRAINVVGHDLEEATDIPLLELEAASSTGGSEDRRAFRDIRCTRDSNRTVEDAYQVELRPTADASGALELFLPVLDIFGAREASAAANLRLSGDGICNDSQATAASTSSSTDGGGSSSVELNGTNAAGQLSGSISGAVGGCEDGESQEADCLPHIDIIGASWGWAGGSPNLMEVGVTLSAAPGDLFADYIVTVIGAEGSRVQEQIRALRGELTCESFRGGLPGEACVIPEPNQFMVTVDISELMLPLKIELFSLYGSTGNRLGDLYFITNIGE